MSGRLKSPAITTLGVVLFLDMYSFVRLLEELLVNKDGC